MRRVVALAVLALLAAGCRDTPTKVYQKMARAAEKGDEKGFLSGFTDDSARLVRAMIYLSRAYGFQRKDPYSMLAFDEVMEERVDGDRAVLTVRDGAASKKLLLVKKDGDWRIDVFELETFWEKRE